MSKASPAESPKKDSTRKPVLGKFGNLFNTSKKKQSKGVPESPTSPLNEKTGTTFKSEKEIIKQQKKVHIVVTTNSKVKTQVSNSEATSEQCFQDGSKDSSLPVGQREKKTTGGNDELSEQKTGTSPVKDVENTSSDTSAAVTNALSESSQKLSQKSTPKFDRQTTIEKSAQASTHSPGRRRRSSTDIENSKSTVRRLSQENNSTKDESPKTVTRKISKFSGKVVDSKYKVPDKSLLKLSSTEKLNTAKISHQVDQPNQGLPVEQSLSPDAEGCKSIFNRQASDSDTLSPTSPSEGEILSQEKPDRTNGHSSNGKLISVDIYLSKNTGNVSPTARGCTNGEAMEKNSPNSRKINRKRRSTKSQSSLNEEKRTETLLQDDVFDESSIKGTSLSASDSSIKSVSLSPESNGTESSSQEIKAGANAKLSPKAESDKDKQHHPASSPMRKKISTVWTPSSPTGRKALVRDPVFKNQALAASARVTELNQPASVTTTKDAYVEKASVPGSLSGGGGEDLIDTAGDKSSSTTAAAGILSQNNKSEQQDIQAVSGQFTSDSDGTNQQSNSHVAKPQDSVNDASKSTITSQLNIPAKSKNVELPIKPKPAVPIDDPTTEVRITKGNIASKVSLFESKKTSHRQIDFYATKNISQPKKFVERAKLNFGKQAKGNVLNNTSFKPASPLHANNSKKIENGHSVTKVETGTNEKSSIPSKQRGDSSVVQGIHMPMEENTNGLKTVLESIKTTQESILPLAGNEQQDCQPTKITSGDLPLNENKAINSEEHLPHLSQISDTNLEEKASLLKTSGDINSNIGHINMGNKLDSVIKQPDEDPATKEPTDYLANDTTALPSNLINSSQTVTSPCKQDELQINDSKEVPSTTKEPSISHTKDTTTLSSVCADYHETGTTMDSSEKKTEGEHLLHSSEVSENYLDGNIDSLKSFDSCSVIVQTDSGNKLDEEKEQPADVGTTEETTVHLANDTTGLHSDCIDSSETVTPVFKPEDDQINDRKGVHVMTEEPNISHTKEPTTLTSDCMDCHEAALPMQSSSVEPEKKTEEDNLLHSSQVSENSLGGNTSPLKSGDLGSVTVHADIDNKHNEVKEQSPDVGTAEEVTVYLDSATRELHSEHIDSSETVTPDEDQIIGIKVAHDLEKVPEQQILEAKESTKPNQPEVIHSNDKQDLQNGDISSSRNDHTRSDDSCMMTDKLPQSEDITREEQEQPVQLTNDEEMQQHPSLMQKSLDKDPSLPVHNETVKLFANQKEPLIRVINETEIFVKHTNGLEGEHVDTEAIPMQTKENVLPGSSSSQGDSKQLDVRSQLLENTVLKPEALNNHIEPKVQKIDKVVDGVISTSHVCNEEKSIIECEVMASDQTVDILSSENDPSSIHLDGAVSADKIIEGLENTKNEYINVISNVHEEREVGNSTEVNNVDVNVHVPPVPIASVLQNGCTDASDTGNTQHVQEKSFLDVQKSPDSSFNISVGGEENTLDSSSDMEIFAETIRKLDSPINLPQKRKKPRTPKVPGPHFGLPPIHEDYMEKILDNEAFSFGLGKKNRTKDLAPMALFKLQSKETAEKLKPRRASTEQSLLFKSLRSQKEPLSVSQETCDKENADVADVAVKKSRIESMYSSLKLPCVPREENVFTPTVTTVSTITCSFDTPRKEFTPSGKTCDLKTTDSAKEAHTAVREDLTVQSSQSLHSMNSHPESDDFAGSLPDDTAHQKENHCTTDGEETLPPLESTPKTDKPVKDLTDIFYFNGQNEKSLVTSLSSKEVPLQGAEKINPRPGKLVILTEAEYGGAVFEVFTDVADCSSWELSPTIFIKTIRGCWLLYEQPNFEGRTIAVEEGDIEVTNPWGEESQEENSRIPVVIGSLRHVVKDYRLCQIDLFTDPGGLGIMSSYFDDTEDIQTYGRLQRTCSIKVHWGVWLIYEEDGFQGVPFILEPGEYPDLSFWNTQEAYIGSLRPLKMGSRKVEIPNEPKIIIFEKPMYEGRQAVLDKETMSFEGLQLQEGSEEDSGLPLTTVGSMRVIGGLWAGYEKPEFEGHQYLLEEGDYEEWSQWGGYNGLLRSLRPILSEFSTPHMIMYSEKDFDEKAANINVLGIISNMDETGFGMKIQSINVLSGVWVAYECPDFTGEQYILEKGMYSTFSDWGAKNCKISSVQPILMEHIESPGGHFKVEVFSEPDFQGQSQTFEEDVNNVEESFKILSMKVSSGRWTVHDQADFSGNLWVLEEGVFPNLCAMGCPHDTIIRSLKIINYEFSEPNAILYGKENFKGRRVKLTRESADLQALGYSPDLMSLEVLGGIWVLYEHSNYRGQQLLILPSKIAQWKKFSGWNRIGSLRPLWQKRLYFKLRNKASGMVMSTNGTMDDIKLLRIQVSEDSGAEDQIWVYHKGVLRCRLSEDCSLASAGTLITAGSKLGLNPEEPGTAAMLWSVTPGGRIFSRSKPNLVLDIKGGSQYDQQHVVLNPVTEGKLSQMWEICVL